MEWNDRICCLLYVFTALWWVSRFLIISPHNKLNRPASTHKNKTLVWTVFHLDLQHIELCWGTPPSKGQTVKYWIISTSNWNETGWWANLLSALRLPGAAAEKKRKLGVSFFLPLFSQSNSMFISKPHTQMSLIIIWIHFHRYYSGRQSMSEVAFNSCIPQRH